MIGIYKITNKANHRVYIGQSVDIERRKAQHLYSSYNENANDYNTQLHQAIRKYGKEQFDFEVLVEIKSKDYSIKFLNELESLYIKQYDSFKNGYNATEGGLHEITNRSHKGEKNGRALLTTNDVKYIRECYNAHIPFRVIQEEFKEKISKRGLQKI